MNLLRLGLVAGVLGLVAPLALADEGNQQGQAYLKHSPARIGGNLTIEWGSPGLSFAQSLLVISDGLGPTNFAPLGLVCLDLTSPGAQIAVDTLLDVNGAQSVTVGIPNIPGITASQPVYALALVVDTTLPFPFVSLSKTVGIHFENPDAYSPTAMALVEPRSLHTATALNATPEDDDIRVLVTGGGNGTLLAPVATATTEFFDPRDRTFTAGPNLAAPRALHQAVRLNDGRVLVIGGVDNTAVSLQSCELFDPATDTFAPAASMTLPRAGHVATLLPNGKVLVTGGIPSFVNGQTMLAATLNAAHNGGEVYDPVANTWTPVSNAMASKRFGHAQILLDNGLVLVTGGISGGTTILFQDVPTYTGTCNLYDPATNAFAAAPSFANPRGAHALSRLPNGDILLTGGIVAGFLSVPTVTPDCRVYNGASWSASQSLPAGVALHTQFASAVDGSAIIQGGLTGTLLAIGVTAAVCTHDGATSTSLAQIGTNPGLPASMSAPRGGQTATRLYDGTTVLIGGTDGDTGLGDAFIYLEP